MKHAIKLLVLYGISVILCSACKNKQYFAFDEVRTVKTFPNTYELGTPEEFDLNIIGVQGIKILNDDIVISCSSNDDCLYVFSKSGMSQKTSLLNVGNGPGEILYSPFMSWMDFSDNGRYAYVYDFKGNYLEYDLSASVNTGNQIWRYIAEKLPVADGARYFYINKDELLCRKCKTDRDGYERFLINCNGQIISTTNVECLNEISSYEMNLLSTGFAINDELHRIAEFGSRINVIHLYSYVDDFAVTLAIHDKISKLEDFEQLPEIEMRKMYYDSKSFDDFFAALYLGTIIDDLDNGTFGTPSIHIFDWDGNPIAEIVIPVRALFFDIDIRDKKLYVVEYETDHILKYDISEILNKIIVI